MLKRLLNISADLCYHVLNEEYFINIQMELLRKLKALDMGTEFKANNTPQSDPLDTEVYFCWQS